MSKAASSRRQEMSSLEMRDIVNFMNFECRLSLFRAA
jgi:hypothetical protein